MVWRENLKDLVKVGKMCFCQVRISLHIELHRFSLRSVFAKYSYNRNNYFLEKVGQKGTRFASKQELRVTCFTFSSKNTGKTLVYFSQVCLFSDSAKAKHIFKFSNSFKEERRKYFSQPLLAKTYLIWQRAVGINLYMQFPRRQNISTSFACLKFLF